MDFKREWTDFALDAEVETFGVGRIRRAHNAEVARLTAALAAEREKARVIIGRGVALMSVDQVSEWEGVRAYCEMEPADEQANMTAALQQQTDYSKALQGAILAHCRGELVPPDVAKGCSLHAQMLNSFHATERLNVKRMYIAASARLTAALAAERERCAALCDAVEAMWSDGASLEFPETTEYHSGGMRAAHDCADAIRAAHERQEKGGIPLDAPTMDENIRGLPDITKE